MKKKSPEEKFVKFNVCLPPELYQALEDYSMVDGRERSPTIARLLEESLIKAGYLKPNPKIEAIKNRIKTPPFRVSAGSDCPAKKCRAENKSAS